MLGLNSTGRHWFGYDQYLKYWRIEEILARKIVKDVEIC